MIIEHFGGKNTCGNLEDLENILRFRTDKGLNEFWIWISEEIENPCMAMLVKNDYAYLHFFPEEGHPGFQSVGQDTDLDEDGDSTFYTGSDSGEEVSVPNYAVLPFQMAVNAVKEFFETKEMPQSVDWEEL